MQRVSRAVLHDAGSPALSYPYRHAPRPILHQPDYIDLTQDDEDDSDSSSTSDECLAYCPICYQHLEEPFNKSFTKCGPCNNILRIRLYPCSCPPPDHDAILRQGNPQLAAAIDAYQFPLSDLAKRVLLLVAQVPPGKYTTYIALADRYMRIWGMTSRTNMGAALKKEDFWPLVPAHRVIAKNGGIAGGVDWGNHGQSIEERIELLEGEGMRFDKRGYLLGGTFVEFRS